MNGIRILQSRYRELIWYKTWAGLRAEASQNYLSFLWWVFDPLLSMAVYYLVFGVLIKRSTEDFVPFLLIGLICWQWFANSVIHSMNSILGSRQLMTQVDLPKAVFPSVVVGMDVVKFLCVLVLLLVFLWCYGFKPTIHYLGLPVVLLVQLALIIAFAYFTAGVIPFFPDLRFLVQAILQLVFFLSGVLFDGRSIPEQYQQLFYLNPMANILDAYRDILMYGQWPDWAALGVVSSFGFFGVIASYGLLAHYDRYYLRIIAR
ncbi:MAG: ABC transporter permease [Gammaproteobacteria bacterium]|nr:ABC transporter permease [Gammaproteobacteria bacterium]